MTIEEFFIRFESDCMMPDGRAYFRPSFLWKDKVHDYYVDLDMERPVLEMKAPDNITTHCWCIYFTWTPYGNRTEYRKFERQYEEVVKYNAIKMAKFENISEDEAIKYLKSCPVELWLRDGVGSSVSVKMTAHDSSTANIKNFHIEYNTQKL